MYNKNNENTIKIPVLTHEELAEWAQIKHCKEDDDLAEKRFWKRIYEKNGLKYESYRGLADEFDKEISDGTLTMGFLDGSDLSDLTDKDKITLMSVVKNARNRK